MSTLHNLSTRHPVGTLVVLVLAVGFAWLVFAPWPPGLEQVMGRKRVFLNAILSGIHAAEAAFEAIVAGRQHDKLDTYETAVRTGPIAKDLKSVRNAKPLLPRFGTRIGTFLSGADMWLNTIIPGIGLGYTLRHGKPDSATLKRASQAKKI